MTILYVPHTASAFVLCVLLQVGAIFEPPQKAGISHLVEHLCFASKATLHGLERVAITYNAITGKDMMCFFVVAPPQRHAEAVRALASVLFRGARFTPEVVERERKVILEEALLSMDKTEDLLLAGSVYEQSIIGTPQTLRNISPDDARAHYLAMCRGCVVAAAGPLSIRADVLAELHAAFSRVLRPPATRLLTAPVPNSWSSDEVYVNVPRITTRPRKACGGANAVGGPSPVTCTLAFRAPPYSTQAAAQYALLHQALVGNLSSALVRALRGRYLHVYSVKVTPVLMAGTGMFVISFQTSDRVTTVLQHCFTALHLVARKCMRRAEYDTLKAKQVHRLALSSILDQAVTLGTELLYTGATGSWRDQIAAVERETLASFCRAVKSALFQSPCRVVVAGGAPLSPAAAQRLQQQLRRAVADFRKGVPRGRTPQTLAVHT